jgi:hypothetical protein
LGCSQLFQGATFWAGVIDAGVYVSVPGVWSTAAFCDWITLDMKLSALSGT